MRALTVGEASFVVERPAAAINRAVDRGLIWAGRETQPDRSRQATLRKFGPAELRYLLIEGDLKGDLTPAARRRIYEALRASPENTHHVQVGPWLALELADADTRIAARLARLEAVKAFVDESGVEPVLRGTDGIPVHVIAALGEGQGIDETMEDYVALTRQQVEAAVEYAQAYPKPGRPYPARSFKRMLLDMADMGVFDPDDVGSSEDGEQAA